jgi:hypothetical protein
MTKNARCDVSRKEGFAAIGNLAEAPLQSTVSGRLLGGKCQPTQEFNQAAQKPPDLAQDPKPKLPEMP